MLKKCVAAFGRERGTRKEPDPESEWHAEDACDAKDVYMISNGALLLLKQISSGLGKGFDTDPIKVFSAREIEDATLNYDPQLVLGRRVATGYKGTMDGGRVVAVKSPGGLPPTESIIDFFLNQVVIKQIINHKNVAKLYGCCLETRVPTLVYEFFANGTLSDQIYGRDGINSIPVFNISWSKIVKVAAETSHALSYMHIALPKPIIHMDVKPSNIYLDESFTAKLTNFGFSVSISPGEDFISWFAVGTFAYTDPEYQSTRRVTEKCDVYSFGVTLMELLTGRDPDTVTMELNCKINMVHYFSWHFQRDRVFEIVHPRILAEASAEEIQAFARVAMRCSASKGEERPSMKEVATDLRRMRLLCQHRQT